MGVENPYDDSVIKGAGWTDETLKAIKEFVDALETLVGAIDAATTDSLHGKLGTDTELADYSLYDLLGGAAFKTHALSAMLGALTATDNLKGILGAYTTAAPLKAAIDAIAGYLDTEVAAIEAKLDTGGLGKGLVTKALTFANNDGQVALFTVTGDVIVRIVAVVKTTCGTLSACNISVGILGDVDAIIPVTDITDLAAQEIWHDATPDSEIEALGTMREHIISDGNDITLNTSAGDNSGAITFYCFWTALSSGATVVA